MSLPHLLSLERTEMPDDGTSTWTLRDPLLAHLEWRTTDPEVAGGRAEEVKAENARRSRAQKATQIARPATPRDSGPLLPGETDEDRRRAGGREAAETFAAWHPYIPSRRGTAG